MLYTDYVYFFQAAGIVLLIAMIGAIVLTLQHRPHVQRQDVSRQIARTPGRAAWKSSTSRAARGSAE